MDVQIPFVELPSVSASSQLEREEEEIVDEVIQDESEGEGVGGGRKKLYESVFESASHPYLPPISKQNRAQIIQYLDKLPEEEIRQQYLAASDTEEEQYFTFDPQGIEVARKRKKGGVVKSKRQMLEQKKAKTLANLVRGKPVTRGIAKQFQRVTRNMAKQQAIDLTSK